MSEELLAEVATHIGDSEKSVAALGTVFATVRIAVDKTTYTEIKQALPRVESWMGLAFAGGGGRTGEMLALIGPKAIERNLGTLGLNDVQITHLGIAVAAELKAKLTAAALEQVTTKVPFLKR